MVFSGKPGDSCEIYEKINKVNGKGIVAIFANTKGEYHYITASVADNRVSAPLGTSVSFNAAGNAVVTVNCERKEAVVLFFGVN
jgi:hypothetical protein